MKLIKKMLIVGLVAMMLVACGGKGADEPDTDGDVVAKKKVAFVTNSNLGDNSLVDVIWRGITKAAEEYDLDTLAVELDEDATKQIPTLLELAESEDYELIIAGTFNLKESVEEVARMFPDQKFLAPDVELDYSGGEFENVVSFLSAQNEGSFLGGALAALMTTSGHEYTNPEKVIGFVGGAENTAINDFLVGYIEGAKYIDEATKVLFSYVGDFSNSAKGKELTLAQYGQGADIVYGVAGGAGFGVMAAAEDDKKFALGVDMDQGSVLAVNNPKGADHVLTSVQKNMDISVHDLISQALNGDLDFGKHLVIGVADNGMSLSDNETFQKHVPQDIQDQIKDIEAKIASGEIVVSTAIGMSQEEVNSFKDLAGK